MTTKKTTEFIFLFLLVFTFSLSLFSASPFGYDAETMPGTYTYNYLVYNGTIGNVTNPATSDLDMDTYQIIDSGNQVPAVDNSFSNGWVGTAWANVYSYIVGLKETTGWFTNYGTGFQNLSHINTITLNVSGKSFFNGGWFDNLVVSGNITAKNINFTNSLYDNDKSFYYSEVTETLQLRGINVTGNVSMSGKIFIGGNINVTGNMSVKRPFWFGYDNSTQLNPNTGNVNIINISNNNDILSHQMRVVNRQNLTFQTTGIYRCILSPQFWQDGGSTQLLGFWYQKNGVDVPWSNSRYSLSNNQYYAPAIEYGFEIRNPATDNIRFMWYSDSTTTRLWSSGALTSPARPSVPAVILDCNKISEITG